MLSVASVAGATDLATEGAEHTEAIKDLVHVIRGVRGWRNRSSHGRRGAHGSNKDLVHVIRGVRGWRNRSSHGRRRAHGSNKGFSSCYPWGPWLAQQI